MSCCRYRVVDRIGWGIACAALMSCAWSDTLVRGTVQPTVYLLLSAQPDTADGADSSLYALCGRNTADGRFEYVTASEFRMSRRSDGAVFAWQSLGQQGVTTFTGFSTPMSSVGNYRLAWLPATDLGRSALVAGDTFDLRIAVGSDTVRGWTVLPGAPVVTVSPVGAPTRIARWSRPVATAGFGVRVDTDYPLYLLSIDTSYVIRNNGYPPANPVIVVSAFERNMWRYLSDTTVTKAGITGGLGYFGAIASTTVRLK